MKLSLKNIRKKKRALKKEDSKIMKEIRKHLFVDGDEKDIDFQKLEEVRKMLENEITKFRNNLCEEILSMEIDSLIPVSNNAAVVNINDLAKGVNLSASTYIASEQTNAIVENIQRAPLNLSTIEDVLYEIIKKREIKIGGNKNKVFTIHDDIVRQLNSLGKTYFGEFGRHF